MDSRAWLIALGALAAALAISLVVSRHDPRARGGGRVLSDFDPARVDAVMLDDVSLRRKDDGWLVNDLPADPRAVREILGTLETLAIQRRDDGSVEPGFRVRVMRDLAHDIELVFEKAGGATDRVWAARKDQPGRFLVDGYLVRALHVGVDKLRETRPLRGGLEGARTITITAGDRQIELEGPAWRMVDGTRVDPSALRALEDALDRLRMTSFADRPAGDRSGLIVIEADGSGSALELGGACDGEKGRLVLRSPLGSGCVDEEAIEKILRLADPRGPLIDRRPISARPELVKSVRLRRGAREVAGTRADQPDSLLTWLESVNAAPSGGLAEAVEFRPDIEVEVMVEKGADEAFAVGRAAGGALALRRGNEPVVLLLSSGSGELFEPAPHRFRSLELIVRDPTDLSAAARGDEAIVRGETLEEWRALRPAGATVDAAAAQRLAEAVATLRATRVVAARAEPRHALGRRRVELTFDAERHTIDVGAATEAGGCYARLDRDPVVFELSSDRCAPLAGPWTTGGRSPP